MRSAKQQSTMHAAQEEEPTRATTILERAKTWDGEDLTTLHRLHDDMGKIVPSTENPVDISTLLAACAILLAHDSIPDLLRAGFVFYQATLLGIKGDRNGCREGVLEAIGLMREVQEGIRPIMGIDTRVEALIVAMEEARGQLDRAISPDRRDMPNDGDGSAGAEESGGEYDGIEVVDFAEWDVASTKGEK